MVKMIFSFLAVLCLVGSVEANPARGRTVIRQRTVIRGGGARFVGGNVGFSRARFFSSSIAVGNVGYAAYAPQVVVQPAFVQAVAVQAAYVQPQVVLQPAVVPQVSYISAVQVQAAAVQVQAAAVCPTVVQPALLPAYQPALLPAVAPCASCGLGSVSGAAVRIRIR